MEERLFFSKYVRSHGGQKDGKINQYVTRNRFVVHGSSPPAQMVGNAHDITRMFFIYPHEENQNNDEYTQGFRIKHK
jgi:hypothetical protein